MVIQPSPRITRVMMDHFRRQIYSLLLATIEDPDLIHRVIRQLNDPDPQKRSQSSFRSWTESRNALLGYVQLSKRIILESENVIQEAKTAIVVSSSEISSPSNIPSMPSLEKTLAIAEFLGLGEELDVSKRHIAAVATFSRQMDVQKQKITDLEKKYDHQEREISQLRRWASVRRKEGSPILTRPNSVYPSAKSSLMENMFDPSMESPRVEMETPTGQFTRPQHLRGPPTITASKLGKQIRGASPALHERAENLPKHGSDQDTIYPDLRTGLATSAQSGVISAAFSSRPAGTSSMDATTADRNLINSDNLKMGIASTPQTNDPFAETSVISSRESSFSRAVDPTIDRRTADHRRGTSSVRGANGYRNPLPDTPEIVTPPLGYTLDPKVTVDSFLRSDLHPTKGSSILASSTPQSTSELDLAGDESPPPVKKWGTKRFLGMGGKKKESLPLKSDHEAEHHLGFSDSNGSSTTSGPHASGCNSTPRDKAFNEQRFLLKKKGSLAHIASRIGLNNSDSDSFDLKAPALSGMSQKARTIPNECSTTPLKENKKNTKTPRIRSRISGRLLEPHELGLQGRATFAASRQNASNYPEGARNCTSPLSSETRASRQSTDTRRPRPSMDTVGRPGSALSQNSRQPNVLRKIKSQSSVKTTTTENGAAKLFSPKSPRTPNTSDRKKGIWGSIRSNSNQDRERVFTGKDHEPFPFVGVPTGFQFPDALDNETPEQTAALEEIRAFMIAERYEKLGLNRDGTEKISRDDMGEETQQHGEGGLNSHDGDGEDCSFMTPTPKEMKDDNEDDKSPLNKFIAAVTHSYSPRKPELATWHLNIPQAIMAGSSNEDSFRPQTSDSDYALSSVEDLQSDCFADDIYRNLQSRTDFSHSGFNTSTLGTSNLGQHPSVTKQ